MKKEEQNFKNRQKGTPQKEQNSLSLSLIADTRRGFYRPSSSSEPIIIIITPASVVVVVVVVVLVVVDDIVVV
jgi:uncharacterized membrane protein YidH (DUF202 family)